MWTAIRQWIEARRVGLWGRYSDSFSGGDPAPGGAGGGKLIGLGLLLVLIILYYVIGGLWVHKIDDDLAFVPDAADLPAGGSVSVGVTSGLLNREVRQRGWTPDDPWFYPTALLDNMPNFQKGIRTMSLQMLLELKDQIARTRGSGGTDQQLEEAFQSLSYPPDWWWVGLDRQLIRKSSTASYEDAIDQMRGYNSRVASGEALFERRADSLFATLDRVALSLGAASAMLADHVDQYSGDLWDTKDDDIFYDVRGRAYAAILILEGLRTDYADLIAQRGLENVWNEMQDSLKLLLEVDPLVVMNGDPDGMIKNHLSEQGFALLRARTQLREITSILQK